MHSKNLLGSVFIIAALLCNSMVAQAQCGSWTDVGTAGFTAGNTEYNDIAIDANGTPYMVFLDDANGDRASVRSYTSGGWNPVGSQGFSAGTATFSHIAINAAGVPYVVYVDWGNSYKVTVMRYNVSYWINVGNAGFSAAGAAYTDIAIDTGGTPYVVFQDASNSSKATVMKFDGSNWVTVGAAGLSAGAVDYCSIAIDHHGTVYVAYEDEANSNKATVMQFDGSSWMALGGAGFSPDTAYFTSIAIDTSGVPYLAYQDKSNSNKATVAKYNGSSWATVGSAGFSAGEADWVSLALDSAGTPFVAYKDIVNSNKASVMKYDGSSWGVVGALGFSAAEVYWTTIAIDGSGTPYVGYSDWGNNESATVMDLGLAINTGTNPTVCAGATNASLAYTSIGSPLTYSISYSGAATSAGFTNVTNATLPASPITIPLPAGLGVGTYTGTLTASNGTCNTQGSVISITVNAPATPSIILSGPTSAAPGDLVTINATVSNAGSSYSIVWKNNGTTFNTTIVPTVSYTKTAGPDAITAILTVTSAGCYNADTSEAWDVADSSEGIGSSPGLSKGEVTVYPNPFVGQISIKGLQTGDRLSVYDFLGRKRVDLGTVTANIPVQNFHFAELPAGTYFLHVWDAKGNTKANIAVQKIQ